MDNLLRSSQNRTIWVDSMHIWVFTLGGLLKFEIYLGVYLIFLIFFFLGGGGASIRSRATIGLSAKRRLNDVSLTDV